MAETIADILVFGFMIAAFFACAVIALQSSNDRAIEKDVVQRGVEVEAEVLARFEAGALVGSALAKARQPLMAAWDPRELELRYVFSGQPIVSRRRVSVGTFFRTRGRKTLKIRVLPDQPEKWAPLA